MAHVINLHADWVQWQLFTSNSSDSKLTNIEEQRKNTFLFIMRVKPHWGGWGKALVT